MQNNENVDEWISWIEEAISKKHIKYYEFENFKNIQEIGSGAFGKAFRANWKNFDNYLALKSFYNLNKITLKEIVHELILQRDVDFHGNIIRFYGIAKFESGIESIVNTTKNYLMVMEYADNGTLRDYLKNNFHRLTWDNKYSLAYQLACSILCLHDEGIVHRDLHSCNVLVHQNSIKLADFGLSKRIDEASNSQTKLLGMVPYIDPKVLMDNIKLNEKSDVYSIGVLLWEISSGYPPFCEENYNLSLMYKISQGRREEIISNTPDYYSKLYTECWNGEPNKRPSIHEVVNRLRLFPSPNNTKIYRQNDIFNQINSIPNENITQNSTGRSLHGQMIQNFNNANTNEIYIVSTKNLSIIVNEIVDLIFKELNKIGDVDIIRQFILDHLNNNNMNSKEIYNWLLYNQNDPNSIFLLGYFNYNGIRTTEDEEKAFLLFFNASELFKLYRKAANLGHMTAQYNLARMYEIGDGGIEKDIDKAIYWYEQSAKQGSQGAQNKIKILKKN